MVEIIVNDVLSKLNIIELGVFGEFVGIEDYILKMNMLLFLEFDEVRMVGIWGFLGIGKIDIVRVLFI